MPQPAFTGIKVLHDYPLEKIRQQIDWTPFFQTWELFGKYPEILKDEKVGTEATKLFNDANQLLDEVVSKKLLKAEGVIGFYPAVAINDDDIEISIEEQSTHLTGETTVKSNSKSKSIVFHFLRQQHEKALSQTYYSLADFVRPKVLAVTSNEQPKDHIGFFAVTAGIGIEALISKFEKEHDDYNAIMIKALADRLAEAFAETLHEEVRKEYWGYSKNEMLTTQQLINEDYPGIRPAPGYPACPDHTEKRKLFDLLQVEKNTGIRLTESFAMYPASSVSGFYFSHPQSKYFGVGKIARDQVEDYAKRKGISTEEAEKWLSQNLSYGL